MVQLTIDNARECQRSKTQSLPRVPDVPGVPFVPHVRVVRDVSDVSVVSVVRGVSANARCPQKNRTKTNAECRVGGPRVSKGSSSSSESGKPGLATFYHPVRRSGVPPSLSKRGAFGIRTSNRPAEAGTQNTRSFHVFQVLQAFHFFHPFQPFQKRAVSTKNETQEVTGYL